MSQKQGKKNFFIRLLGFIDILGLQMRREGETRGGVMVSDGPR